MDLRRLRYFEAVATRRSFSRAALDLHVAQSAVSQQVRNLEAELGVELLRRTTRSVELTEAGELVLERARHMAAEADALRADVDALRGLVRGHLVIGGVPPIGGIHAAGLIAAFVRAHPGVELRVREDVAQALVARLRAGEIDLVLALIDPDAGGSGVEGRRLATEELVAIMPADHPLARRKRVPLDVFAREPLVSYGRGSALQDMLVAAVTSAGVTPRLAFEADDIQTVKEMVALGLGVSLLPRSLAEGGLVWRSVTPRPPAVPVSLLWRTGSRLSPAARAFREHVLSAVGETPQAG